MDIKGLITELLKQNRLLTPLEQDILDTYNELSKKPLDRNSAIRQSQKNNVNHPDIFVEISHGPTLIDHNVLLSDCALKLATQGVAVVHNLIAGEFQEIESAD